MKISWQYKTAVISTAHVNSNDADIIQGLCYNTETEQGLYFIHGTVDGWIVRAHAAESAWKKELAIVGVSEGAINNIQMVLDDGFDVVHFDAGADLVEELAHWDW